MMSWKYSRLLSFLTTFTLAGALSACQSNSSMSPAATGGARRSLLDLARGPGDWCESTFVLGRVGTSILA